METLCLQFVCSSSFVIVTEGLLLLKVNNYNIFYNTNIHFFFVFLIEWKKQVKQYIFNLG